MVHNSSNTILISILKSICLVLELNNYPLVPANQPTFLCTTTAALAAECLPIVPSYLTLFHLLCVLEAVLYGPHQWTPSPLASNWVWLLGLAEERREEEVGDQGGFSPSSLLAEFPWVDCLFWFRFMAPVGRHHASHNYCTFCGLWDKMDSYLKYAAININLCLLQITVIDLLTCT